MRSVPAPHVLVIRPRRGRPGELAEAYIKDREAAEREARRREPEVDLWLRQRSRNRDLGQGRAGQGGPQGKVKGPSGEQGQGEVQAQDQDQGKGSAQPEAPPQDPIGDRGEAARGPTSADAPKRSSRRPLPLVPMRPPEPRPRRGPSTALPRLAPILPPQALYTLPERDRARIRAAAARIEAQRSPPSALPSRLSPAERDALVEASRSLRLGGVATEAEVDEIFAGLHAAFPWLGRAPEALWRQARLGAARGEAFHVGPMLLLGTPGLGKSTFARRLGGAFGVPTIPVDVGQTGGVFDLQGTDSKWGSSSPGRVMRSLLSTRIGNPVVVVDEVDASGPVSSTGGRGWPGIARVLMGMIEPSTAAAWVCPYHEVPVDLRHHSWILTANSVAQVEQALLDRCRVVELPPLSREHLLLAARAMAAERLDEEAAAMLVEEVARALRRGAHLGLRRLARIVDAMEAVTARPVLQ